MHHRVATNLIYGIEHFGVAEVDPVGAGQAKFIDMYVPGNNLVHMIMSLTQG
jgi:hypothetical protein